MPCQDTGRPPRPTNKPSRSDGARLREFVLTAHVISSVGFLGAVAAFMALAIAGATGRDAQMVSACSLAMELVTSFVIVPMCFASLLTGLVQSLVSPWGLFRHYWVVVKLLLTMLSTAVLLIHTKPIGVLARIAAGAEEVGTDLAGLRFQLVVASGAALLVLLAATVLSIYRPPGMTPTDGANSMARLRFPGA
jgi:hypothetical protein